MIVVVYLDSIYEGLGALMSISTTTSLPRTTMIEGVVESSCDGCNLLSLVLFVCITMWHCERTSRPKHERGFVSGNHS